MRQTVPYYHIPGLPGGGDSNQIHTSPRISPPTTWFQEEVPGHGLTSWPASCGSEGCRLDRPGLGTNSPSPFLPLSKSPRQVECDRGEGFGGWGKGCGQAGPPTRAGVGALGLQKHGLGRNTAVAPTPPPPPTFRGGLSGGAWAPKRGRRA